MYSEYMLKRLAIVERVRSIRTGPLSEFEDMLWARQVCHTSHRADYSGPAVSRRAIQFSSEVVRQVSEVVAVVWRVVILDLSLPQRRQTSAIIADVHIRVIEISQRLISDNNFNMICLLKVHPSTSICQVIAQKTSTNWDDLVNNHSHTDFICSSK